MTDHSNEHQPLHHEMTTNYLTAMRIKEERVNRNITQQSMAEQLHMDISTYSRLENGKIEISIARLEAVAKIFNIQVNALLPIQNSTQNNNSYGIVLVNNNSGKLTQILDIESLENSLQNVLNKIDTLKKTL